MGGRSEEQAELKRRKKETLARKADEEKHRRQRKYPPFIDHEDGTITDTRTGLMLQKTGPDNGMSWDDAIKYCSDLSLAGYDDWRLPVVRELDPGLAWGAKKDYELDGYEGHPLLAFKAVAGDVNPTYWSASAHIFADKCYPDYRGNADKHETVYTRENGRSWGGGNESNSKKHSVRCVRGVEPKKEDHCS